MGLGVLFTTVRSAISTAQLCTYTTMGDSTCSGDRTCQNVLTAEVCDQYDCEKITCALLASAVKVMSKVECFSLDGNTYQIAECEEVSDEAGEDEASDEAGEDEASGCDGDDVDVCMSKCSSVNGKCEDCTDEKLDMALFGLAGKDCNSYIAIARNRYNVSEFCGCSTRYFELSKTTNDFMIGCKSSCAMDSDSGSGKDNIGMIIGIVIGAVVLVAVVIAVVFCMRRKKL